MVEAVGVGAVKLGGEGGCQCGGGDGGGGDGGGAEGGAEGGGGDVGEDKCA
jgi:hypothetical protein